MTDKRHSHISHWHPVQLLVAWLGGFAVLGAVAWQQGALSNRLVTDQREAVHGHAERSRKLDSVRAQADSAERWYFELSQTRAVPDFVEDARQNARSLRTAASARAELVSTLREVDERRIRRRAEQAAILRSILFVTGGAVTVALLVITWMWAAGRSAAPSE